MSEQSLLSLLTDNGPFCPFSDVRFFRQLVALVLATTHEKMYKKLPLVFDTNQTTLVKKSMHTVSQPSSM